jgi:adenine phosphoribosyltransferase
MADPLSVSLKSITTAGEQTLVLDGKDAASLRGSRVGIIDDVVSTGGSLRALRQLLESTGCRIACQAAVLLEEGGYSGEDLVYLARLPVFTD